MTDSEVKDINNKPAVRLHGAIIKADLNLAARFVCFQDWEGWVPKSISRVNDDKSLDCQEWFYNVKIRG